MLQQAGRSAVSCLAETAAQSCRCCRRCCRRLHRRGRSTLLRLATTLKVSVLLPGLDTVRAHVALQFADVLESPIAVSAVKWTHLSVDPSVYNKISVGCEPLVALLARVWFFSCVCANMDLEHFARGKRFVTVGALEGSLTGV